MSFPTQIASLFLKQDNNITHDSQDLMTVINSFHSFNCKGYITNAIDVREGENNTVYIVTCSVRYKILESNNMGSYGLVRKYATDVIVVIIHTHHLPMLYTEME